MLALVTKKAPTWERTCKALALYIMEETRANKNTKQEKQHGRVLDFKKSNPPTTMYRNDERYGRCASMYQQKHGLHAQVGAVKCATKR